MWTGPLNEVLVWTFDLDAIDPVAVTQVLSIDERDRAARFRFDIHRERYIAGRAALRYALAAVTGATPAELEFAYGPHGKPELRAGNSAYFNLSHSENRAILGVTRAAPVGVDIERVNHERGGPEIARRFFAPEEIAELERMSGAAYTAGFFECWARKEAVLKAVGTGIAGGLSSFAVPTGPMPELFHVPTPDCWIGNLSSAFPYIQTEGFASAIALLGVPPLVGPVCGTVLRIPVRRTFK